MNSEAVGQKVKVVRYIKQHIPWVLVKGHFPIIVPPFRVFSFAFKFQILGMVRGII